LDSPSAHIGEYSPADETYYGRSTEQKGGLLSFASGYELPSPTNTNERRRRATWAGTEIGKAVAEGKAVGEDKVAVGEARGTTESASEAVGWGIVRALQKKG
jgi:hypothetical protein